MSDDGRIRELVQRAGTDSEFAAQLLRNPGEVASEYGLTTEQVEKIKELVGAGAFTPAVQAHNAAPAADYY